MNDSTDIPGYDYGAAAKSPVTIDELAKLKEAASLTEEDRHYLTLAGEVLSDQAENLVDAWRARIGAQEHLAKWFYGPDGKPDEDYKAAVKRRFPTLIVWGPQDGYMPEGAARAYLRDLPDAELHLLDGGHWALETNLAEIVALARDFLERVHEPRR